MRTLIEELQYIWDWLEDINHDPDRYDFRCYQSGLSREQISSLTKRLPFSLPEEMYQLYEWKNGEKDYCDDFKVNFLFLDQVYQRNPLYFYPLQDAIKIYRRLLQENDKEFEFWNEKWFPIAGFESRQYLYMDLNVDPSPIIQQEVVDPDPDRVYISLNAMISVIAECCEMDVYDVVLVENARRDYVRIKIDEAKRGLEKEIFEKYNS